MLLMANARAGVLKLTLTLEAGWIFFARKVEGRVFPVYSRIFCNIYNPDHKMPLLPPPTLSCENKSCLQGPPNSPCGAQLASVEHHRPRESQIPFCAILRGSEVGVLFSSQ